MFSALIFNKSFEDFNEDEVNCLLDGLGINIKASSILDASDYEDFYEKSDIKSKGLHILFNDFSIAHLMVGFHDPFEKNTPENVIRKEITDIDEIIKSNKYLTIFISSAPMVEDVRCYVYEFGENRQSVILVYSLRNINPDKRFDFISPVSYING